MLIKHLISRKKVKMSHSLSVAVIIKYLLIITAVSWGLKTVYTSETNGEIPAQCLGLPGDVEHPQNCCDIPSFFEQEDWTACEFHNLRRIFQKPQTLCKVQACLFRKYNLMVSNHTVDKKALLTFMDQYAGTYPSYSDAVRAAKETCVGETIPGPAHVCEPNRVVLCVSHTMFSECPTWKNTSGCKSLKKHFDKCKPYFWHNRKMGQ